MSENLAIWKSNNKGFKEAKFIQTGRRGRHTVVWRGVERSGEEWRHGVAHRGVETGTGGPTSVCGG